jgi:hypothetical protein
LRIELAMTFTIFHPRLLAALGGSMNAGGLKARAAADRSRRSRTSMADE